MRSEHDRLELAALAALRIDPTTLESGPDDPIRTPGWRERVYPDSPMRRLCSACGTPASYTRLVRLAGLGPRWIDYCRDHMIAGWLAREGSVTA